MALKNEIIKKKIIFITFNRHRYQYPPPFQKVLHILSNPYRNTFFPSRNYWLLPSAPLPKGNKPSAVFLNQLNIFCQKRNPDFRPFLPAPKKVPTNNDQLRSLKY